MGLLVVPQSLARLHHRRDLTYRPLTDAPQSSVALSWPEDATTDLVEDFIGIVRGRTVNSTRGRTPPPAEQKRKPAAGKTGSGKAATGKATSGKAASGKSASGRAAGAGKNPRGRAAAPKGARGAKGGKPRRRS